MNMIFQKSKYVLPGGAARVSFWGGEPYIGQFFVFSAGEFSRVLFHTRPIFGGAAAPPRTPVQPPLLNTLIYD